MIKNNDLHANATEIIATSQEDKKWIREQLISFNSQFMSIAREEYNIPLNFHLRDSNNIIIAGVNAYLLAKSTAYVDILWVDKKYRGYGYGSHLLEYVEMETKN